MRRVVVVAGVLVALLVAALVALERSGLSEGARSTARRILLTGFGVALTVLFAGVALLAAPWWLAASAAGVALVSTGAYAIASGLVGLPTIGGPGAGNADPTGCTPDRYGEVLEDGSICLGN